MPTLYRVTLGAFAERGLRTQVEYWTDPQAVEDRVALARALGRAVSIEPWAWASGREKQIDSPRPLAAAA
jgi:hypothetical protein